MPDDFEHHSTTSKPTVVSGRGVPTNGEAKQRGFRKTAFSTRNTRHFDIKSSRILFEAVWRTAGHRMGLLQFGDLRFRHADLFQDGLARRFPNRRPLFCPRSGTDFRDRFGRPFAIPIASRMS